MTPRARPNAEVIYSRSTVAGAVKYQHGAIVQCKIASFHRCTLSRNFKGTTPDKPGWQQCLYTFINEKMVLIDHRHGT